MEYPHLVNYAHAGSDTRVMQLYDRPREMAGFDVYSGNIDWKQNLWTAPNVLRLDGFEDDLRRAVPNVKQLLRVIAPEMSTLTDWQDMADIVGRCRDLEVTPRSIQFVKLDKHTHSYTTIPGALLRLSEERVG